MIDWFACGLAFILYPIRKAVPKSTAGTRAVDFPPI